MYDGIIPDKVPAGADLYAGYDGDWHVLLSRAQIEDRSLWHGGRPRRAEGADPLHVARHAGFAPGSKILYHYVDESLKVNPARGLLDGGA